MKVKQRTSAVWHTAREYWVYAHLAADGSVLYIGCTGDRIKRERNHKCGSPWYAEVVETRYEGPYDRETGFNRETELITAYDPPNNIIGTSRRRESLGWRVGEFYAQQARHEYLAAHRGHGWPGCRPSCSGVARRTVEERFPRAEVEASIGRALEVAS